MILGPHWRFPDMWRWARGGFRPVESEFVVKKMQFLSVRAKKIDQTKSKRKYFLASRRQISLSLTWKSDSSSKTAYRDNWACLESLNFNFMICFEILNFMFFVFLAVTLVPELFKQLRKTPGNNFHQVSCKSEQGKPNTFSQLEIWRSCTPPVISC